MLFFSWKSGPGYPALLCPEPSRILTQSAVGLWPGTEHVVEGQSSSLLGLGRMLLEELKMSMALLVWDNCFSVQECWIYLVDQDSDFLTPRQLLL